MEKFIALPRRYFLLLSLVLTTYGCGISSITKAIIGEPKYVSSLSDNVSFTVFPFNKYLDQIEFSTHVEKVLVQVGLNVVQAPLAEKTIEIRKGAGVETSGGQSEVDSIAVNRTEGKMVLIERYSELVSKSTATYIVQTMISKFDGTVKIYRKEDMKILGAVNVDGRDIKSELIPFLEKLNFISKKNTK